MLRIVVPTDDVRSGLAVKGENSQLLVARYPQIPDFTPDEWKLIKGSSDL